VACGSGAYATLVLTSLRLFLPVAGVAGSALLEDDDGKALAGKLDATKKVVDSATSTVAGLVGPAGAAGTMADTTAAGLYPRARRRAAHAADRLFELDSHRDFGGMRRVFDHTGDVLWVCPTHYSLYDPLPDLPDPPDLV
jgi:hypothetical protein